MPQDQSASSGPGVLFTAFEPSGDDHASAVIAQLHRRRPDVPIYAWGGPKMEAAGATLLHRTGENAVMGVPGLGKVFEHRRINRHIEHWMAEHRPAVLVPVDSPAANFPICALARRHGASIVHLVAPQVWAWGPWRINKLRARTDLVLCLLPFEESWFSSRRVRARFIGHPLFDEAIAEADLERQRSEMRAVAPQDSEPRLALMPGSRPAEIGKNFPLMLDAFRRLRQDHPSLVGMVAATTPTVQGRLREIAGRHGGWPPSLGVVSGRTDAVIAWCDLALVVSGTVTLQVARQRKPMIVFYKSNWLVYTVLVRWMLSTSMFSLPNLIAGQRIVPELIPHFGDAEAIVHAVSDLLESHSQRDRQRQELDKVVGKFAGRNAALTAAEEIEHILDAR